MAYTWNGLGGAARVGTDQDNWTPQSPVGGPEAGSDILYNNTESALDGSGLPTSMPSVELGNITVSAAYTLSDATPGEPQNLTAFTGRGDCTWLVFNIASVILKTPNGAEILADGTLVGGGGGGILDSASPVTTAGDCTIDWALLDIRGGINAGGDTITHLNGVSGTLTCDVTGTLNLGSVTDTGIAIDINAAGDTVTSGADLYCGDFTITDGTFVSTNFEVFSSGTALYVGGAKTDLGLTMTGTGTVKFSQFSQSIDVLTIAETGDITTAGVVFLKKLIGGAGAAFTILAGDNLRFFGPVANWWNYTGTMVGDGAVWVYRTDVPWGPVDIDIDANFGFIAEATDMKELTVESNLRTSKGVVISTGEGKSYIVNMNGFSLGCNQLKLGHSAATGSGILNLGTGMHSIGSLVDSNAVNAANAIDFGAGSHVEFSGLADFDNIAVTASTSMPPEIMFGPGGKITNCEPDNEIAIHGDRFVNPPTAGVFVAANDDVAVIEEALITQFPFTVAGTFNTSSAARQVMFFCGRKTAGSDFMRFEINAGDIVLNFWDGASDSETYAASLNDGARHHIAITSYVDTGAVKGDVYIDGKFKTTLTNGNWNATFWSDINADRTSIGRSTDVSDSNSFDGKLWNWSVYNGHKADADDALRLYNGYALDNPTAIWRFDEGTGVVVADSSGNNKDLTYNGDWEDSGNNNNITNFINNQSYSGQLATMGIGGGRLLVSFWLAMAIYSSMEALMC